MPLHFPSIHRIAHAMATGSPFTVMLKKKKKTWKNNQYNIKENRQCMNISNEIEHNFLSIHVFVTKILRIFLLIY